MKTYTQMKSIQNFNKKALLGALVAAGMTMASTGVYAAPGTATGTMTTDAAITSACSVSNSTLNFGTIAALNVMNPVTASTTMNIACTTGTAPPVIYSTTPRVMDEAGTGTATLPFNLSQVSAGGTELAITSTGETIGSSWSATGAALPVTIHGQIPTASFEGKPVGSYTAAIVISVDYL